MKQFRIDFMKFINFLIHMSILEYFRKMYSFIIFYICMYYIILIRILVSRYLLCLYKFNHVRDFW